MVRHKAPVQKSLAQMPSSILTEEFCPAALLATITTSIQGSCQADTKVAFPDRATELFCRATIILCLSARSKSCFGDSGWVCSRLGLTFATVDDDDDDDDDAFIYPDPSPKRYAGYNNYVYL
jgi:hypothetical protein